MSRDKEYGLSRSPTDNRRQSCSGQIDEKCATGHMAADSQAPCGKYATGKLTLKKDSKIGTWNVRGLLQPGKLSLIEEEMERLQIDVLGLSETHWRTSGHFKTTKGNTVYHSGKENNPFGGVAIVLSPKYQKAVIGYTSINDRIIQVKIDAAPCKLHIIQVYAPTANAEEDAIDEFYNSVTDTIRGIPKRDVTMIMGDWNAKVGNTEKDDHLRNVVGLYGMGIRNDRGEKFLQFCTDHRLTIMNTWFQHHIRRQYTWISPGDRCRNQIDYIAISSRWRSFVHNTKTYPGADCGSDHQLLVSKLKVRLRILKKPTHFKSLNNTDMEKYSSAIAEKLETHIINQGEGSEESWNRLKETIISTAESCQIPQTSNRKSWISEATWKLMQLRREIKSRGFQTQNAYEEYNRLNKAIAKSCRGDKNQQIDDMCKEIEAHEHKNEPRELFQKVKILTRDFKSKTWLIENARGEVVTDFDSVIDTWRVYCEKLYSEQDEGTQVTSPKTTEREPNILQSEIEFAIKKLKINKSPGSDNVSAELLKSLGGKGIKIIHDICNKIWSSERWPVDWTNSQFVPLHKKGSTTKCDNYRTISLISHASKILLSVLNSRLHYYTSTQIPQEQAGFVKGRGTREQILNIRQLIEKCREFQIPAVLCFIDYSKAFDCVNWDKMWKVLIDMGVPAHLVNLLKSLYQQNSATVKINGIESRRFQVQKGVRQGCILSPDLFNVYGEFIMRKVLENWEGGIAIGGKKISNLRYADDTTLIAKSDEEMSEFLRRVEVESRSMGLEINRAKTKLMIVDRANKLPPHRTQGGLETVNEFIYLGSRITNEGGCEAEVKRRIGMAKSAMARLEGIWKNRSILIKTKMRLVRTLIFSICLYGAETWTLKASERRRLDSFEMYCWRRMLRIPWTAKRTNVSILNQLQIQDRLSTLCLGRVLQFFGHIARREDDNLERLVVVGSVEGRRGRGRSPIRWTDQIKRATGLPLGSALQSARSRERWRKTVRVIMTGCHDPQQ